MNKAFFWQLKLIEDYNYHTMFYEKGVLGSGRVSSIRSSFNFIYKMGGKAGVLRPYVMRKFYFKNIRRSNTQFYSLNQRGV